MKPVVVLGGGIAGSSVALALRKRGAAVVVVDAATAASGLPGSATGAAGGMLTAQYETPDLGPLSTLLAEARARHPTFAAEVERLSGMCLDRRGGGMLVANCDAAQTAGAAETVRWQRSAGLAAEVVDASRAGLLQTGLPPEAESWLWLPDEARLDAQKLPVALWVALARSGAELRTGLAAVALDTDGDRVRGVRLADGSRLKADKVVVALGVWSAKLEGLPRTLPIRPVRGQMLHVRGSLAPRRGPLVADHAGRYVIPRADGSVLLGSTMEEAGFEVLPRDRTADQQLLLEEAGWLWPACQEGEVVGHWSGLRPLSPDGLPVLGPDPFLRGLHYAAGYGRSGILLAPLAGDMVADLVLETKSQPGPDWSPFRIDRFGDPTALPESKSGTNPRERHRTRSSQPHPPPETLRTERVSSSSG
ncbi:MAG: FAD-dependent oxidoreductase [Gemmatimonadota bacterium]